MHIKKIILSLEVSYGQRGTNTEIDYLKTQKYFPMKGKLSDLTRD